MINQYDKIQQVRIRFTLDELQAVDAALDTAVKSVVPSVELFQAVARIKKALAPFMTSTSNYAGYIVAGISPNAATMRANKQAVDMDKILAKIVSGVALTKEESDAYDNSFISPATAALDEVIDDLTTAIEITGHLLSKQAPVSDLTSHTNDLDLE
jgi:hypothetical protein